MKLPNLIVRVSLSVALLAVPALASTAVTYVGSGTFAAANNANVTPTLAAGHAANDINLVLAGFETSAGTMSISGYTQLFLQSSAGGKLYLFCKVDGGSESNPAVVVSGGIDGNSVIAKAHTIRGALADCSNIVAHAAGQHNGNGDLTVEYPALTISTANTFVAIAYSHGENNATGDNTPAGFTDTGYVYSDLGSDQSLNLKYQVQTTATNLSAGAITIAGSQVSTSKSIVIALKSADSPPPGVVTSQLWGTNGELFDPAGRLPDVSYAGYQNGETNPPNLPQVINAATQYGANGNDTIDDAPAIQAALDAANNGAVFLPAGTYYLDEPLQITKSNVVLRGASSATTILRPRVPLDTLLGVSGRDANYGWTGYVEIAAANPTGEPQWPANRDSLYARLGTKITDVTAGALRGGKGLTVASTSGLAAGQEIRLRMTNPLDNSLGCHFHNDLACLDTQSQGWYDRKDVDWVVKIESISGNVIQLNRPLHLDVRTAWTPEIWTHTPPIKNSGVEDLTIEFPDEYYSGHHYEPGWHAVWIGYGDNCWARNLRILDADRGIEVTNTTRTYVGNIYFGEPFRRAGIAADPDGVSGHYGVAYTAFNQDSLAENLDIDAHYFHNISMTTFVSGNVYSSVRTLTGSFDHHGAGPYDNVYTDIEISEDASDLFRSGGNSPGEGMGTTFWNIRRESGATVDFPALPSLTKFPVINLIGISRWTTSRGINRYIEREVNTPINLYEAQLAKRLGAIPNGPVAHWKLDEGSGTAPQDSSSNANHCVMSPPPTWTTGYINGALSFDGVDDTVSCGSGSTLATLAQITVSAWVNLASAGEGGFGRIVQKGSGGNPTAGWRLVSQTNNRIEFSVDHATADVGRASAIGALPWNSWVHVAATWAGSTNSTDVKVYVNGAEVNYGSAGDGSGVRTNDDTMAVRIGNNGLGTNTVNGKIDDVRIYNRVLSISEIQALANGTAP